MSPQLTRRLHGPAWHALWFLNTSYIGVLFLLHPQRSYTSNVEHKALGSCVLFAPLFFMFAKMLNFSNDHLNAVLLTNIAGALLGGE